MNHCLTTEWSARTTLLPHQVEAVTKTLPPRVGGLFMEMGTGKTRTAIELARLRQSKIDCVVWFCPVSIKRHIYREILKHTNCVDGDVYVFNGNTTEERIPEGRLWYIVGIESMSSSARLIFSAQAIISDRTMVVVDESTYIKGHKSLRTKRITKICEVSRYRLILSGTPLSQGVVDIYSQMRFLSVRILGYKSFYTFAANHIVYSRKHPGQIVGSTNVKWLAEKIAPYVYQVLKKDCLNLPAKMFSTALCHLSDEQLSAYQRAKDDFLEDMTNFDDDDYTDNSIAIFRLFSRLQAIVCGFDKGGKTIAHNRLELLEETLDDCCDTHVVIWTKYRKSIDQIADRIVKRGPVYTYDGRLGEAAREDVLGQWKASGGYLVATQSIGGHGIDLTESSTVIFYSSGFKYSEHVQAEDRCHRIGQTRPVTYIGLFAYCGIEDRIREAIKEKRSVLDTFRREVDKIKTSRKDRLRELIKAL